MSLSTNLLDCKGRSRKGAVLLMLLVSAVTAPAALAADYSTSDAAAGASLAPVSDSEFISLRTGYPQMLVLERPASNIIVGNPASLTVSLLDPTHVLLTPITRGAGSLILLDEDKSIVKSFEVAVDIKSRTRSVTIHRALVRSDYECSSTDCVGKKAK